MANWSWVLGMTSMFYLFVHVDSSCGKSLDVLWNHGKCLEIYENSLQKLQLWLINCLSEVLYTYMYEPKTWPHSLWVSPSSVVKAPSIWETMGSIPIWYSLTDFSLSHTHCKWSSIEKLFVSFVSLFLKNRFVCR